MAEADLPSSDDAAALAQEVTDAQAAVAKAIAQLALDEVTAALNPTAANLAAVTALKQRVATDEALLASLYAMQAATGGGSGGGSGGGGGGGGGGAPTPTQPGSGRFGAGFAGFIPPPIIPVIGVVASGSAAAEGAWGTFLDETEGLVEINNSLDAIAASSLEAGTDIAIVTVGGGLVASLVDLPATMVALLMLLVTYGIGKLLTFVGRYFPNPNILGWHPLNFIRAGIQDAGQALVDSADLFLQPIVNLFLTPIHLLKSIFQRVVNAIAGAHNKVAHVATVTIPQAEADAVAKAKAYTDLQVQGIDPDELNKRITGISDTLGEVQKAVALNAAKIDGVSAFGAVGLAAVTAVIVKTLTDLKTKVDTCMVDNCDTNGPNGLKTALLALLAGLTDAAEIAYVVNAIVNPVTFADQQAPLMEGVDTSAVDLLNTILSL